MRHAVVLCTLLLAGCATGESMLSTSGPEATPSTSLASSRAIDATGVPTTSCEGKTRAQCKFINSPVKLSSKAIRLPGDPYPYFETRNTLKFVDATQGAWVAPAGILTDGASIPPVFVPFIGDPRSREFMNAATVHDAYSARANRNNPYYHAAPWQDVHRMFYDALIVSGTPVLKARIMYAAVYLGGPRWKEVRTPPRRQAAATPAPASSAGNGIEITPTAGTLRDMQSDTPLPQLVPKERLIAAFKRARDYIRANNNSITIADVEIYLTRLEMEMTGRQPTRRGKKTNFRSAPVDPDSMDYAGSGLGNSDNDNSGAGDAGGQDAGADGPATNY